MLRVFHFLPRLNLATSAPPQYPVSPPSPAGADPGLDLSSINPEAKLPGKFLEHSHLMHSRGTFRSYLSNSPQQPLQTSSPWGQGPREDLGGRGGSQRGQQPSSEVPQPAGFTASSHWSCDFSPRQGKDGLGQSRCRGTSSRGWGDIFIQGTVTALIRIQFGILAHSFSGGGQGQSPPHSRTPPPPRTQCC